MVSLVRQQVQRTPSSFLSPPTVSALLTQIDLLDARLNAELRHATDSTQTWVFCPAVAIPTAGRPFIFIYPSFLQQALALRLRLTAIARLVQKTSGLAVSAKTVRRRILEAGLRDPGEESLTFEQPSEEELDSLVRGFESGLRDRGFATSPGICERRTGSSPPPSSAPPSYASTPSQPSLTNDRRRFGAAKYTRLQARTPYGTATGSTSWSATASSFMPLSTVTPAQPLLPPNHIHSNSSSTGTLPEGCTSPVVRLLSSLQPGVLVGEGSGSRGSR